MRDAYGRKAVDLHRVWGDSYRLEGDDLNAVEQYKKALALNRSNIGSMINLGWTYIRLGQNQEAQELMMQAYEKQPNNIHILRALEKLGIDLDS